MAGGEFSFNSGKNESEGNEASFIEKTRDSKQCKENNEMNYKTELCRTWVEKNYCPYNEKCRFAHGKKDLHEKQVLVKNYKKKECSSFYKKGFCPYGPRCNFRHDERKLNEIERVYYQFILNSDKNIRKFNDLIDQSVQEKKYDPSEQKSLLRAFQDIRDISSNKVNSKITPKAQYNSKKFNKNSHPYNNCLFNSNKANNNFLISKKILDSYM